MQNRKSDGRNGAGKPLAALLAPLVVLSGVCLGVPKAGAQNQQVAAVDTTPDSVFNREMRSLGIAATVNDQVITTYDVEQRLRLVLQGVRQMPDEATLDRLRQQILRSLVDEHLKLQEAAKFEVQIPTAEIQNTMSSLAERNNMELAAFKDMLKGIGIDPSTLEHSAMADIAWRQLVSGRFGSRVTVTDAEAENMMDRMKAVANRPKYAVSEIFLPLNSPAQAPQVEAQAMEILQQMEQGAPFAVLAQNFSQAPSAASGGDIGWVHEGELQEELDEVLKRLRPGQVSTPIRTVSGYHIIALRERQMSANTNMDDVKLTLKQIVAELPPNLSEEDLKRAALFMFQAANVVQGCDSVETIAEQSPVLEAKEIGEVEYNVLAPNFQEAVQNLMPGDASEPVRSESGIHILVVCDREGDEVILPSMDEIKDQIFSEEIQVQARRYLRDLRRDATVEYRM